MEDRNSHEMKSGWNWLRIVAGFCVGLRCYKVNDKYLVVVVLLFVVIDDGACSLHESKDARRSS